MDQNNYQGSCFCGAVQFTLSGVPEAMGYCHCESCRRWSGGPLNSFTLWKRSAVRITRGADKLASYAKSPNSQRSWCTQCGGHVLIQHPEWQLTDVCANAIDDFPYAAGVHVNYQETRLPMHDGLLKLRDFPAEFGGTGQTMAE